MPNAIASAFSVASLSNTPNLRIGSASPRNADPIALIASSGVVLLNDARSDARVVNLLLKFAKSWPPNPAALPKVPNVPAACKTADADWPIALAAVLEKSSTDFAPAPKITFTFDMFSSRSDAAEMAGPIAAATPASAAAAGMAAFLIRNCAFSPAVSSFLKSLIARSSALPLYSAMIGIESVIVPASPRAVYPKSSFPFLVQCLCAHDTRQAQ